MGASIDLSGQVRALQRLRDTPKKAEQAVQRARSTLARRLPVQARRDLQSEYALPATRIAQGLSVRATAESIELIGAKRGIGLIAFTGRWGGLKSAGASAQVFVDESRHIYGGTFIARGNGGNRQIFSRAVTGSRRAARLPIRTLYGPSVAHMLRRAGRADRLADFARDRLAEEINRLMRV